MPNSPVLYEVSQTDTAVVSCVMARNRSRETMFGQGPMPTVRWRNGSYDGWEGLRRLKKNNNTWLPGEGECVSGDWGAATAPRKLFLFWKNVTKQKNLNVLIKMSGS